ncbi:MAG: hypothetical protein KC589_05075 [Nanoarchaeota archaeon]|nr:hypothetical protein [Nanoarchaeota archaeon]
MQTDLLPFIKNRSHVSRATKELEKLGLIICKTPNAKNYKLYETTSKILEIKEEVEKYSRD